MSDDPIRLVDGRAVLHIIGNAYDDSADFTSADYVRIRRQVEALPSVQPRWTTDVNDILAYLDDVVHPLASPENWNVYSELHDMISDLLKHGEGEKS